jgi:hypothetical protein
MTDSVVGYFPKRTDVPAGWQGPPVVEELGSVSECLAPGPTGWINSWRHNDLGFFDTPELARSVIPADTTGFSLFGYRLWGQKFVDGRAQPFAAPPVAARPLPETFRSLGFDVVSKSVSDFFECSPLSCNGMADGAPVNRYCLVDSREAARSLAERFSREQPEPGEYYVFEVFREQPARG